MTITPKNAAGLNGAPNSASPAENSENKSGQSPRSNPVCLEVSVTLRSLPSEAGSLAQPIREDGRTVIVFDNGAVLRSANSLPVGQTVILSNSSGRDVVCRIAGGRNIPNLKGYVEVEFIEPVNDFWGLHIDSAPSVPAPQQASTPAAARENVAPGPALVSASAPVNAQPKPAAISPAPVAPPPLSKSVEPASQSSRELPEVPAIRDLRPKPSSSVSPLSPKLESDYSHTESAKTDSIANWATPVQEPDRSKQPVVAVAKEDSAPLAAASAATSVPTRDFMSQGILAYDKTSADPAASSGRTPLIVGIAALALAGVCGVVYFLHRNNPSSAASNSTVASAPASAAPTQEPPPAASPQPSQDDTQASAQPVNQDHLVATSSPEPAPVPAPTPAVAKNPPASDSAADARAERRSPSSPVKDSGRPAAQRPAMPSLKIAAPIAPKKNVGMGESAANGSDLAAPESGAATPSASLLTSSGRTSNPPTPPAGASALQPAAIALPPAATPAPPPPPVAAAKRTEAKLISAPRLVYPPAARQSNVQGTVTVSASIDATGKVVGAKALSGPLLLRGPAEDSVRQWRYSPALLDGKAMPSQLTVNVEFRLN